MNPPPATPPRDFPQARTVHGLVAEQAGRTPHRVAVRCGEEVLTYDALRTRSLDLARRLQSLGAGPGCLVGLCLDRSLSLPTAVLGVLESGAAYVPMDPAFPAERLRMMAEDADLSVIVTQRALAGHLPVHRARVLLLDDPSSDLPAPASPPPSIPASASPSPLAYVLFTSGSTGRPKGVQITHHSFVNFLRSMQREPGCAPDDILLSVTTLSFDIAGLELMLPLVTGATVVIATRETASDGELLREELERTGATLMQATPVTWRLLLASRWTGSPRLKILVGGESVPRDLVNLLAPRCASLWNMYGPTETTIWSTTGRLEAGDGPVSVGRPIDNTRIYIVDPELRLQPPGTQGEILIGGEGVAVGYLGRPELTAERFLPDPFTQVPGARVYRTGDLGLQLPDGSIQCLGRLDDQVKIRGYRIEMGEIEAALRSFPGIAAAAAAAREVSPGDTRLVAYLVPTPGAGSAPDTAQMRRHTRERVPEYMVPSLWVTLDRLPFTPNGKLDRKALPQPDPASASLVSDHVPPASEPEIRMVRIWCEILRLERVGMTDGFFDLGGNSLLAVRLFAALEREFGRRLPLATLLRHATPAGLLDQLTSANAPQWRSLVPIQTGKPDRLPLFCVHGAGGNLLLYRDLAEALGPDIPLYGFQSRGLDGETTPLESIEAIAQAYVEELLAAFPNGPFLLGGYCMGGTVAYEMARRLVAENHRVPLLALFDTYNFDARIRAKGAGQRLSRLGEKVAFHLSNLARARGRGRLEYLRAKLRLATGKMSNSLNHRPRPPRNQEVQSVKDHSVENLNHEAGMNYRPAPTPVKLTVYKPSRSYSDYPDPKMGWEPFAHGGLEIVELPLNPHAMLVAPYVRHLADDLRRRLDALRPAPSRR